MWHVLRLVWMRMVTRPRGLAQATWPWCEFATGGMDPESTRLASAFTLVFLVCKAKKVRREFIFLMQAEKINFSSRGPTLDPLFRHTAAQRR